MQIILENPFLRKIYLYEGSLNAIIDTGYAGFLSVPNSVFQELDLNKFENDK